MGNKTSRKFEHEYSINNGLTNPVNIVTFLAARNIGINDVDNDGETPLFKAIKNGNLQAVFDLLRYVV